MHIHSQATTTKAVPVDSFDFVNRLVMDATISQQASVEDYDIPEIESTEQQQRQHGFFHTS